MKMKEEELTRLEALAAKSDERLIEYVAVACNSVPALIAEIRSDQAKIGGLVEKVLDLESDLRACRRLFAALESDRAESADRCEWNKERAELQVVGRGG
jgi:hypothetical protein